MVAAARLVALSSQICLDSDPGARPPQRRYRQIRVKRARNRFCLGSFLFYTVIFEP